VIFSVFKYKKGADFVLVVDKRHYETYDGKNPVDELRDGDSAFVLVRTESFYFISGDAGRCKQGQKLIVLVTAETAGSQAPSPLPSIAPFSSIAASPDYYLAEPPLVPSPFKGPSTSSLLSPTHSPHPHSLVAPHNAHSMAPVPSNHASLSPITDS
jgi:hypothetical protein